MILMIPQKRSAGSALFVYIPTFGTNLPLAVARLSRFNCEHSCGLLLSRAGSSAECSYSYTILHHVLTENR